MKNRAAASAISTLLLVVVVGGGLYGVWMWFFCRFYVGPDQMAIITSKVGTPLDPGRILAGPEQKGVREKPLAEGRHFLNPWLYEHQIVPIVRIEAGKVGIVTSKVGSELASGEFLADRGQKGIWRRVLGPGKYRLNPAGYDVKVVEAVSIPIGYVGVVTSLSGGQAEEGGFAGPDQKGVREDILQPALYYVNPNAFKIDVLEVGLNQVSLTGREGGQVITKAQLATQNVAMDELVSNVLAQQQEKRQAYAERQQREAGRSAAPAAPARSRRPGETPARDEAHPALTLAQFVEFPSRDGFEIRLDMTVEFELLPSHLAGLFRDMGDLPAVVDKIIMPQILSVSRMKGSTYRAKDFIVGEGRETFQNDLKESLKEILGDKNIQVHNALIRHVSVPAEILDPIQQASLAVEQDLTNRERQNTARRQADLNTEESLIEQRRGQVMQETEKLRAEVKAQEERDVARITAETGRLVAELHRAEVEVRAEITRMMGGAQAQAIELVEGEKAKGLQLKVKALGQPADYTLLEFAQRLNEDIRIGIVYAGEGTLWTDLKNAGFGDLGGAQLLRGGDGLPKKPIPTPP